MLRRRTLPVLAMLATLAAGCGESKDGWLLFGVDPFVMVDGARPDLRPGWGVTAEFGWESPLCSNLRLAWSHHRGEPGWPDAEYFRLSVDVFEIWLGCLGHENNIISLAIGPTAHYIYVDGPGDVGGLGVAVRPNFRFFIGRRLQISASCTLEGWVPFDRGVAGTFSAGLSVGCNF